MALQIPVFGIIEFLYRQQPGFSPTITPYDVRIFFNAATAVLAAQWPYCDFFFPYPPLSLLFLIPPRLIAGDPGAYFAWFKVELLFLDWIGLMAMAWIARQIGQPLGRTLLVYSCALPALGSIVLQRYDLVPAILVLLALATWMRGWHFATWALLAVGTLTKIYPSLLIPLFTVGEWRAAGWRAVGRGWSIFVALVLCGLLPFLLVAFGETLNVFGAQTGRGLEIESTFALMLLAGRFFGLPAEVVYNSGLNTWEVTSPSSNLFYLTALGLQVILLIFVYLRFFRLARGTNDTIVRYSAVTIAIGLLTSRVFSPQFMLWLFPLPFLSGDRKFAWASLLFLVSALLTQAAYPFLWSALKQASAIPVGVLLLRDATLGLLCMLLVQGPPKPDVPELHSGTS
ncbi:MAG: glycosyltransferase family 87 protein [Chloroflexota bacterium]